MPSVEEGRDAFIAITVIFCITGVGMIYAYYTSVVKARKARRELENRIEKKNLGKSYRNQPTALTNIDATHKMKTRIMQVWRKAAALEKTAHLGPSKNAVAQFDARNPVELAPEGSDAALLLRASVLFMHEVHTVFEAYVNLLRDRNISNSKGNNDFARPGFRAPEELEHISPFVGRLEEIGGAVDDYMALYEGRNETTGAIHKLHDLTEESVTMWKGICKTMDKERVTFPTDGRFDVGADWTSSKRKAVATRLDGHQNFIDKRIAGITLDSDNQGSGERLLRRWLPPQVFRHPIFYTVLTLLYIAVMIPFLIGINQSSWRGIFGTFLPIPPQYCIDCLPGGEGVEIQRALVPIVFAIMHTAMLSLILLPVPLCRGLLRDFTNAGANDRGIFPIEDAVWLHKVFGILFLGALFVAPFFWLIAMGSTCMGTSTSAQQAIDRACTAFAPAIIDAKEGPIPPANNVSQHVIMTDLVFDSFEGASFFDARDNVLFLRAVAWPLFFGVTPWILRRGDVVFPRCFPSFVVRNWFEITTYSHYFVAWAAVALAIYARFEVFFFCLITWGLLIIEKIREWTIYSYTMPIYYGKAATKSNCVYLHRNASDNKPTAVELKLGDDSFKFRAGQYIFIKVPSIDSVWHAFSLGSAPEDQKVHLHIGVIAGPKPSNATRENKLDNWIPPAEDSDVWAQRKPTWTFRLFRKIQAAYEAGETEPIKAVVRGPYGSPFQSCFTRQYKACVLVGSGTGLTSALSVLKEVIRRKKFGEPTADMVWFVWTCRSIRDLRWCWRTLQEAISEACQIKAIEVPDDFSAATSAMLGWLGITIFVSRAEKADLLSFLGYSDKSSEVPGIDEGEDYHVVDIAGLPNLPNAPGSPIGRNFSENPTMASPGGSLDYVNADAAAAAAAEAQDELPPLPNRATKPGLGRGKSLRQDVGRLAAETRLMQGYDAEPIKMQNDVYGETNALFRVKLPGRNASVSERKNTVKRKKAPPLPPPSKWKKGPPPPPPPPEYDSEDDDMDYEGLYVVMSSAVNKSAPKGRKASVDFDSDIYVSSQQTDVLQKVEAPQTADEASKLMELMAAARKGGVRDEMELTQYLLARQQGRQRLDIGAWMKEQVVGASMDTKGSHIGDLIKSLNQMPDSHPPEVGKPPRRVAVCYCGPSGLAMSLNKTCRQMHATFEYLAHAD